MMLSIPSSTAFVRFVRWFVGSLGQAQKSIIVEQVELMWDVNIIDP
jgi:hypothetical protein